MVLFERKTEKLATMDIFLGRMFKSLVLALSLITVALAIGIAGYHWIAQLPWIDAFMEASMILGGMGPTSQLASNGAKIFASLYALFSGLIFIAIMGILLTPVAHRVMHTFHIDKADED
ncbi:MAG: hypothetical protein AB9891_15190 [Anaerolineaceae bacterium]